MSVFAQILMIRKYVESWALWVAVDIISVPIYFIKGIVVWSGIYAIFLVLATMGGIAWYRTWKKQQLMEALKPDVTVESQFQEGRRRQLS